MPRRRNRRQPAIYSQQYADDNGDCYQGYDAPYDGQQQYDVSYPSVNGPSYRCDGDSLTLETGWIATFATSNSQHTPEVTNRFVSDHRSRCDESVKSEADGHHLDHTTLGFATLEAFCKAFTAMKEQNELLQKKVVTLQDRETDLVARLAKRRQAIDQLEAQLTEINRKESSLVSTSTEMTADLLSSVNSSTDTSDLHPTTSKATTTAGNVYVSVATQATTSPCAVNAVEPTSSTIPSLMSLHFDRDPREALWCDAVSVGLCPSLFTSAEDSDFSLREKGRHRRSDGPSCSCRGHKRKEYGRRRHWHEDARRYRRIYPQQCTSFGVPISGPNSIIHYRTPRRLCPVYPSYPWNSNSLPLFPRNPQACANAWNPRFVPNNSNREDAIFW